MIKIYRKWSACLMLVLFSAVSTPAVSFEILTVCDSITQGFQRTSSGQVYGNLSPGNGRANIGGYQPLLNQLLDERIEPSTVYNWGIGGETSSQTVGRINGVLNSRPADLILILCGVNDIFHGISSSATSANIGVLIDRSLAKGVDPIVAELTPYTSGISDPIDRNIWANYNPKIRSVANAKGVPIAYLYGKDNNYNATSWANDMRKCWKGGPLCNNAPPYNSGDGLHLSDYGYQVMTDIWYEVIREQFSATSVEASVNLLLLE